MLGLQYAKSFAGENGCDTEVVWEIKPMAGGGIDMELGVPLDATSCETAQALRARGYTLDVAAFGLLESRRKAVQVRTQTLQSERNAQSKSIGKAKAAGEDIQPLLDAVAQLGDDLKANERELASIQVELEALMLEMPNLAHESVPIGNEEDDNVEVRRWGEPRRFDFPVKDHVDLAGGRFMDFEAGSSLAKSRFVTLTGPIARLHRALAHFMLDLHTVEHGYSEVYVPYLVNSAVLRGTGQLPKFEEDLFRVPEEDLYLIPTSEVPLTNLVRDRIVEPDELPIKMTAHTPCFAAQALIRELPRRIAPCAREGNSPTGLEPSNATRANTLCPAAPATRALRRSRNATAQPDTIWTGTSRRVLPLTCGATIPTMWTAWPAWTSARQRVSRSRRL